MLSDDDSVAPFFLARCNSLITDDRDLSLVVTLGDVFDGPTGFSDPPLGVGSCDLGYIKEQRYSRSSFAATFRRKCVRWRSRRSHCEPEADFQRVATHRRSGELGSIAASGEGRVHQRIMRRLPESLGTQTAHFSLGTRLEDFDRLGSVIVDEAEQHVRDPVLVGEIRSLVQSYVAGNFIGHMAIERSRGASRREIRRQPGHGDDGCRARASRISESLPRPVALFILPLPRYGSSGGPSEN